MIGPADVECWVFRTDPAALEADLRHLEKTCRPSDRASAAKMASEVRRRDHLLGRMLARFGVARVAGWALDDVELAYTAQGQPYIDAAPTGDRPRVSIAHTGGLVIVAVSFCDLGIDVERSDRIHDPEAFASTHFHPAEAVALRNLLPADRVRSATTLWVLKEAFSKALGLGLRQDFSSVPFNLAVDPPRLRHIPGHVGSAGAWSFGLKTFDPDHVVAVAARSECGLCVRWHDASHVVLGPSTRQGG